jgi:hypothetical protein
LHRIVALQELTAEDMMGDVDVNLRCCKRLIALSEERGASEEIKVRL